MLSIILQYVRRLKAEFVNRPAVVKVMHRWILKIRKNTIILESAIESDAWNQWIGLQYVIEFLHNKMLHLIWRIAIMKYVQ